MKAFFKYFILISLVGMVSAGGIWLNCTLNDIRESRRMFNHLNLDITKTKSLKPKKNILVFGVSTSIFSLVDDEQTLKELSYVDILKKKLDQEGSNYRIYNFSSIYMANNNLLWDLINFASLNVDRFDYIIFDNLKYIEPSLASTDLIFLSVFQLCSQDVNKSEFTKRECSRLVFELFQEQTSSDNSRGLCFRKYAEYFRTEKFYSDDKKQLDKLDLLIKCIKKEEELPVVMEYLFNEDIYHQNLDKFFTVFKKNGIDTEAYGDKFLRKDYSAFELININEFFKIFLSRTEFKNTHVIIIPTLLKKVQKLQGLPVYINNKNKLSILNPYAEVEKIKTDKHLSYIDLFPDGAHYKAWIHEIISSQVFDLIKKRENKDGI